MAARAQPPILHPSFTNSLLSEWMERRAAIEHELTLRSAFPAHANRLGACDVVAIHVKDAAPS